MPQSPLDDDSAAEDRSPSFPAKAAAWIGAWAQRRAVNTARALNPALCVRRWKIGRWQKARAPKFEWTFENVTNTIWEAAKTIVYALMIAGVFRTVLFQPFWIPSGSMKSTLLIGDFLFVSKYSYGYSQHSLPFSILPFEGRIFSSMPERGDVIVFKHPRNGADYVKRLIGLPGDRIQMQNGILHINGEPAPQTPDGLFIEPAPYGEHLQCLSRKIVGDGYVCIKERAIETLPNGVEHIVLNADDNRSRFTDNTREFVVPEGHFFFMGDNRDNSTDSRADVGMVPFENLVGRADLIALSFGGEFWEFWDWRADRFFIPVE